MTANNLTKVCCRCGEEKPIGSFPKNGNDGRTRNQCKSCHCLYMKEWGKKNPDKVRARNLRVVAMRRATNYEYQKQYQKKNRAKIRVYEKRWRDKNPEKYRDIVRNSRARRLKLEGRFSAAQIARLHERQRGRCVYCEKKLNKYHVDHIVALSKGGGNSIYNLQLLCPRCNISKFNKDPIIYAQSLGRLI